MWLRNNYRPLGELLDEGFLNERRLAWAAEKAYDPQLKQAARVLLAWLRQQGEAETVAPAPAAEQAGQTEQLSGIAAGISVAEARSTRWPFRPYRGRPMGELVDARQLSLKDLGYAVENAWTERVRQAAIVLLALRLNQVVEEPAAPAGPLRVVSGGRSYAERRQLFLVLLQGMVIGGGLALSLALILPAIVRWIAASASRPSLAEALSSSEGLIALAILFPLAGGVAWLVNSRSAATLERLDQEIAQARQGQEGEEHVVEVIRRNLDGDWTLFRNVTLPGRNRADVDGVLAGPPGVWALEVKNWAGVYRNYGERWEVLVGKDWKPVKKSPSRQARDNAARLGNFFRAEGLQQWVEPAVVWVRPESLQSVEQPMVAVWRFDQLPEELGNLWQGSGMEETIRQQMVEKLTALCENKRRQDVKESGEFWKA
jgi:hypothetical protein